MEIIIINLAEQMEYLNAVGEWFWHEWGANQTLENMIYTTRHSAQPDRVPLTYIALSGNRLVGTVALWRNDLRCRQDLFPWMTNLYVVGELQNKGIEKLLQKRISEEARALGFTELYAIALDADEYYENTGWVFKEQAPLTNGQMMSDVLCGQ